MGCMIRNFDLNIGLMCACTIVSTVWRMENVSSRGRWAHTSSDVKVTSVTNICNDVWVFFLGFRVFGT